MSVKTWLIYKQVNIFIQKYMQTIFNATLWLQGFTEWSPLFRLIYYTWYYFHPKINFISSFLSQQFVLCMTKSWTMNMAFCMPVCYSHSSLMPMFSGGGVTGSCQFPPGKNWHDPDCLPPRDWGKTRQDQGQFPLIARYLVIFIQKENYTQQG